MKTVIRKIGNSEGVIIPKDVLAYHDLKAGDEVSIRCVRFDDRAVEVQLGR